MTILQGNEIPATRLKSIEHLGLPSELEQNLQAEIYAERMNWEPWIESAEDFEALKSSLKARGYRDLPYLSESKFNNAKDRLLHGDITYLPTKLSVTKKQTMLRKKS